MKAQAEKDRAKHVKELTESLKLEAEAALAEVRSKLEEENNGSIAAFKMELARKLNVVLATVKAGHEELSENHHLPEQLLHIEHEQELSEVRALAKEECVKHVKELAESLEQESNCSIAAIKADLI